MNRFNRALDRYITGNYGEDSYNPTNEEKKAKFVSQRGHKPIEQNKTKCSYNNCSNMAVSYSYGSGFGLFLCNAHGGKEVKEEERY